MEDSNELGFEQEITKQASFWQKTLALQDWDIEVRIVRYWDMSANTLAECELFTERKDAIIRVLHPHDIEGLSDRFLKGEEADYDISLVHELLHLHLASFDDSTTHAKIALEQAINAISRALVNLYRDQPKPQDVPIQEEVRPQTNYF